jgi:hypothetical protein
MAISRRTVSVAPGGARPYDTEEWRDALVVVESGEIDVEGLAGSRARFCRGDILWLVGLSLRGLSNRGTGPAVMAAYTREDGGPRCES